MGPNPRRDGANPPRMRAHRLWPLPWPPATTPECGLTGCCPSHGPLPPPPRMRAHRLLPTARLRFALSRISIMAWRPSSLRPAAWRYRRAERVASHAGWHVAASSRTAA
eukprot:361272-Chlamydomonas_euryale.AAC.1